MKFLISEGQFKIILDKIKSEYSSETLNEGRNEEEAIRLLKKYNVSNYDKIVSFFKSIDKSKNNKMLPAMVLFYTFNPGSLTEIRDTFEKIFNLKNEPEITIDERGAIKILNQFFSPEEFRLFKEYIEHRFFSEEANTIEDKLISTEENVVFENDKFILYQAPSPHVCIKLFGSNYPERMYAERGFCVGHGTLDSPGSWFHTHRDPEGSWRITFYVLVDKEKFVRYKDTGVDDSTLMTVIGVRPANDDDLIRDKSDNVVRNGYRYFVWDKSNPQYGDRMTDWGSVGAYINDIEEKGINFSRLLPQPYIDIRDDMVDELANNPDNDQLFRKLSPKQKVKYIKTKASILTPLQTKFFLENMPEKYIDEFLRNHDKLGNLEKEAFDMLPYNKKETYIFGKLVQLFAGNNLFNEDYFFEYTLGDKKLRNYAEKRITASLYPTDKETAESFPNRNKDKTEKILFIINPNKFMETLKGQSKVIINKEKFVSKELPSNFGEYIKEAEYLGIDGLDITMLPESIGDAKNLKEIVITRCRSLTQLPQNITYLTNLKELVVSKCALERIPENIGNLKNLETLSLQSNNITHLPVSLNKCSELTMLKLENNDISEIDKNVFFLGEVDLQKTEEDSDTNNNDMYDKFAFKDLIMLSIQGNQLTADDEILLTHVGEFTFVRK